VSSRESLEQAIPHALDNGFDFLLLDGTGRLRDPWPELAGAPDLRLLRDAVKILRKLRREEEIDLVWFGGARSGTDAAKLVALGAKAVTLGVPAALAAGGNFGGNQGLYFTSDFTSEDRSLGVANIIQASIGEASMMARCTGKTNLGNLEPEDLRSITLATAGATGIPLAGTH
jgi:glutamate synthase domain-containing protein 2